MSGIRAVIFDFNGVLWWDEALNDDSWNQACLNVAQRSMTAEEIFANRGQPDRKVWANLLKRELTWEEQLELIEVKESIYRQSCLAQGEEFKLSPGAEDLLEFLMRSGIPRTIATSSEKKNVDFFIEHLRLFRWFDCDKIIFDDGTFPGKPAPEIYLRAAAALGMQPKECMVIEDSLSGVEAARCAGIGLIAALGPKETHLELANRPGVALVIVSLAEISREIFEG